VWDALSELTKQGDKTVFRDMTALWSNPDGTIDPPSLEKDLANFKTMGDVTAEIKLAQMIDSSFYDHPFFVIAGLDPAIHGPAGQARG